MNTAVHFSSASDAWATPQDLFDKLNAEFGFTLDVCATFENAKCFPYITQEVDGLKQQWAGYTRGAVWMNPPYGREIGKWVRKAWDEGRNCHATVVCLLPARTDTRWWHDYIWDTDKNCPRPGVEVRLLRGRLKFGGHKNSAPFPSAVVVFRGR